MAYEMGFFTDEVRRIVKILDTERAILNRVDKGLENKHYYVIGRSFGTIYYHIAHNDPDIELFHHADGEGDIEFNDTDEE